MDGNTRPPIPGSQAEWHHLQQVILSDANNINLSQAGWQQQQVPPSTTTHFLTEPQTINPYDEAYRDHVFESTESLDTPGYFSQTGVAISAQHLPTPTNPPMEMGMTQFDSFQSTANASVDRNGLNSYHAPPTTGYYANEVSGPGVGTSTLMAMPNTPATQGHARSHWTTDQEFFLLTKKREGWPYHKIAVEMAERWPSMRPITTNRLTKRMAKIQDQALEKFPNEVKRAMPKIMAYIRDEVDGTGIDQDTYNHIMSELAQIVPVFVQRKITSRRHRRSNIMRGTDN